MIAGKPERRDIKAVRMSTTRSPMQAKLCSIFSDESDTPLTFRAGGLASRAPWVRYSFFSSCCSRFVSGKSHFKGKSFIDTQFLYIVVIQNDSKPVFTRYAPAVFLILDQHFELFPIVVIVVREPIH